MLPHTASIFLGNQVGQLHSKDEKASIKNYATFSSFFIHSFLFHDKFYISCHSQVQQKVILSSANIGRRCYILYFFSQKTSCFVDDCIYFWSHTERLHEWMVFCFLYYFFLPSAYFLDVQIKISCFNIFFWLKLTFMLHPHPKQYPFPMAPKKYSFIKENVIIGKRKWKFQFGVVVARRKKISNISRCSATKREGESQFLPPRAAGGPLKENSI